MIKAICFDLDGVYFTPESFKRFKESLPTKADYAEIEYVFHKSPEINDFKLGRINEEAFWDFVKSKLDISRTNQELFELLRDSYEINLNVKNFINEVRAKGYKSLACSNNFETRVRELNEKFSFFQDFDIRVFSFEEGVTKPDKKIFEVLVGKTNLKPEEIIYSDDTEEKLNGALELGINAFVFENFEQFKEKLREFGV